MIEVIATLLRWLQLASNMILVGGCVFLAIAGSIHSPWVSRLERALPWLALILLAGLLGILATTTAQATGIARTPGIRRPGSRSCKTPAWGTSGWDAQPAPSWSRAIALYIRYSAPARWQYILCATVASATLDRRLPRQPRRGRRPVRGFDPALRLAHHHGQRLVRRPAGLPGGLFCLHRGPASASRSKNPAVRAAACRAPASRPRPSSASMPCSNRAKKRSRPTPWP